MFAIQIKIYLVLQSQGVSFIYFIRFCYSLTGNDCKQEHKESQNAMAIYKKIILLLSSGLSPHLITTTKHIKFLKCSVFFRCGLFYFTKPQKKTR